MKWGSVKEAAFSLVPLTYVSFSVSPTFSRHRNVTLQKTSAKEFIKGGFTLYLFKMPLSKIDPNAVSLQKCAVIMPTYINPYTDFGFKKLFGEEGNKDLLIDFLNQLLPPYHQIEDVAFHNTAVLPDTSDERKAFFDLHCVAKSGERFIVEMQKAKVKFFKDRSLFYTTFPIREQAQMGDWNFQLSAIYFVAILDFFYDESQEKAKFRRDVMLKDQDCEVFYDKLHFKFLQMPAFTLKEDELKTKFEKWCFFLKNLESFDDIPKILNEPIFEKAFKTAKVANFTPEQRTEYEKSRLNYLGIKAVHDTSKEEGRTEKMLEIAKNLKLLGVGIQIIKDSTGLTDEEIEDL